MRLVAEYIKYRLKAKRRHGIHSPFVYDLSDKCLRQPIERIDADTLHSYCASLAKDNSSISVTDLGSGSKKLEKTRKIKDIFRISSSGKKYGKLLYQLAKFYKPKEILELGTSLGVGSLNLHLGYSEAQIDTIEGCLETFAYTKDRLKKFNKISLIIGSFSDVLPHLTKSYDIIFIDGHHDGTATLNYLKELVKNTHDETIVVLDDIRWSKGMQQAWEKLIDDPNWHVTVDLFRMGILVKRPSQTKEHFVLR